MNFNDMKYVRLVSVYLQNFKQISDDVYNFRCPICGDSKKKQSKGRGYFFSVESKCVYKCHNCGVGMGLFAFLKEIAPPLAKSYAFDRFKENSGADEESIEDKLKTETKFADRSILEYANCISDLPEDNKGRQYLESRKIPEEHFKDLFYIENVKDITTRISKYEEMDISDQDAIVIPFFDSEKEITHIQFRLLNESNLRYITLTLDENAPKIYGLDRVDWSKPVYVCEGPFDSLFIPNCIAVAGVSIMSEIKYLREHAKSDLILIFDKDYKNNPEVYGQFLKAIKTGNQVVMFDEQFSAKDINAQVQNGSITNLPEYLKSRTFSGLKAQLELTRFTPPKVKRYNGYHKKR